MTDLKLGSSVIEDSGTGPAVVMVHGLGGDSNTFQTLMAGLDGYRVLRIDLPGAGRSDLKPGLPGISGMVAAVRDAMRAAGVDKAHLVGHSMGTVVCQHLAATDPAAVLSLTLFGAILEPPPAARQGLKDRAATARKDGMAGIADAVSNASVGEPARKANPVTAAFVRESLMRQNPAGYAAHCEALSAAEPADHAAITCPTLLIAGTLDPVAPVAMGEQLKARIAGAKLEVLTDIGHWIMIEEPQRSIDLLRGNLAAI